MIMTVTIPGKQEKTYSMKNKNTNYKPTDEKREQKKKINSNSRFHFI